MPVTITVPGVESWDESTEQFVTTPETVLVLEHSLVSLSKWESIFEKPFLGNGEKTTEETYAYIHAMCLDENVDGSVMFRLGKDNVNKINDYIESNMTATTFSSLPGRPSREIITNEIIRYWMISFNIPLEYETRHLNQLFTLIRVMNEKNKPQKKMSRAELAARNRSLNEQRQKQLGTTG
jgi:hypothetical protein